MRFFVNFPGGSPSSVPKLTFRSATALSIGLHFMAFLFLSVAVAFFQAPSFHQPPLIFDFVFSPAEEGDHLKDPDETHEELMINPARMLTSSESPEPVRVATTRSQNSPVSESNKESSEVTIPRPVMPDLAKESLRSSGQKPDTFQTDKEPDDYYLTSLEPAHYLVEPVKLKQTDVIRAKMRLSPKQKKMLVKKFKKWTENFHKLNLQDSTMTWEEKDKTYSARFRHIPAKTISDLDEVLVQIETEQNGYPLKTQMRMKRLAFSSFAQFVDYWHPWVAIHNDELDGRFHSNTQFNVSTTRGVLPKFRGKVTTASWNVKRSSQTFFDDGSVFQGGLETGVKAIRLPKNFLPFEVDSTHVENIHNIGLDTYITFHPDGSYSWRSKYLDMKEIRRTLPKNPFYIIGAENAELHVKGVVRGNVLVYSKKKIIIDDDLTYARLPGISASADDYLGLVSDQDIDIAHPSVTGPGDLHIHASIYARRMFRVKDRNEKAGSTLNIYGSLTAGTLTATEPRYATHIRFDKRLEQKRPPNFPMTDRYEIADWDPTWEVK